MAKTWLKASVFILFLLLTGFLFYTFLFAQSGPEAPAGYFKEPFPYDLAHPARTITLPLELQEISGISYFGENSLAAIEDEHGIIYLLDYRTGSITGRYRFRKDADYEDLAVTPEAVYVLRATGNIFRITNIGSKTENIEREKERIALEQMRGAEALCYYEKNNVLLLAYKNYVSKEDPAALDTSVQLNIKPIYAFDLSQSGLLPEPAFILDFTAISRISGIKISSDTFKPAALAVHPLSGHIYLLSSVSKQLLVISPAGELVYLTPLSSILFFQPEGMCFLPNGDLLISSEGGSNNGYLLLFGGPGNHNADSAKNADSDV